MNKFAFVSVFTLLSQTVSNFAMDEFTKMMFIKALLNSDSPDIVIMQRTTTEEKKPNPTKDKLNKVLKENPGSILNMDLPDNGSLTKRDQSDLVCKALKLYKDEKTASLAPQVIKKMVNSWHFPINDYNSIGMLPLTYATQQYETTSCSQAAVKDLLALKADPFFGQRSTYQVFFSKVKNLKHLDGNMPNTLEQKLNRATLMLQLFGQRFPQKTQKFLQQKNEKNDKKIAFHKSNIEQMKKIQKQAAKCLSRTQSKKTFITSLLPSTEKKD